MEPADEELQQLTAPPARAPNNKARAVVACVALASTGLLFAVTRQTTTKVSPAVLAAREIVKQQIAAKGPGDVDTTPGAGPHGPGDADTTHEVDSCSDPCIPCTNAGSYSSFPTIVQHLMVYNKEATPYGGVIFTDRGQYQCLVSRRSVVWRRLHFVDVTRVCLTMSWVVSFSSLRRFGPRRCSAQVSTARPIKRIPTTSRTWFSQLSSSMMSYWIRVCPPIRPWTGRTRARTTT